MIGPGPNNSITDVPGVKVGNYTRSDSGYRSGTTVIRTETGATAGYSQMGGAPGTKETDLLKPGGQVRGVQAIVLSGGSAYGLDAATGVMQWMEEHKFGVPVGGGVVPIVPAAILMDLGRGGDFKKRPNAMFGYKATEAASTQPVKSGRTGMGMGAGWGMGTASVKLSNGYTVAAIVGLNPAGSPVDPRTCLPYGYFLELADEFNIVQPKAEECQTAQAGRGGPNDGSDGAPRNTTIALVATDAPLIDLEAERMAQIANAGLARSIRPIHNIGDGDTVFGIATTPFTTQLGNADLQAIFNAAADVLGRAVVHAVLDSKQVGNSRLGYCETYPSACVKRKAAGR
ncbi:peptidase S58 family protein [Gemmatimonas aurantiaca T-27]|uniref:Peptidase S58 family protein n=1 Tax=Gemmatimonas aurantiaca (strain DSM 14586 / JCM 11422 / NBRC 100505 / T-27) TaxID=379066 RepID=C1ADL1_GEMAT|nr:peptidase S58 family protein [Gemmatimonas aurantiaca T-27]